MRTFMMFGQWPKEQEKLETKEKKNGTLKRWIKTEKTTSKEERKQNHRRKIWENQCTHKTPPSYTNTHTHTSYLFSCWFLTNVELFFVYKCTPHISRAHSFYPGASTELWKLIELSHFCGRIAWFCFVALARDPITGLVWDFILNEQTKVTNSHKPTNFSINQKKT